MKKIILTIAVVVCMMFCVTGCNGLGEKYWEASSICAGEVFASQNFTSTYNIDFCNNLDEISSKSYGDAYAELEVVFKPMFESAISYAKVYYGDFMVIPKNESGEFKSEIQKINESLKKFEEDLAEFLEKKQEYEAFITFSDEEKATSDVEINRLLLFKREYITIIESAFEVSENFFNARRYGYYDFLNYADKDVELIDVNADGELAVNATNLEITKTAIKILRAFNAKQMASEYEEYWQGAQSFYNKVVAKFASKSLTMATNAKERLNVWKGVYNMFIEETQTFDFVLKKLDLETLSKCGYNAEEYANETGIIEDAVYADYFVNFYKNISLLEKYTQKLFA